MTAVALLLVAGLSLLSPPVALQASGLLELYEIYVKVGEQMNDIAGKVEEGLDAYELLTGSDREREPDVSPAGMPRVPSHCAASDECGACYEQAQRKLNRVRLTFERLRGIGMETKEMKDDALAVGQSIASLPGMGLGWYGARRDIMQGWHDFTAIYEGKYRELLGSLHGSLEEIAACEAAYFDEANWFDRFGFIYYQFMEDRYHPDAVLN